MHILTKIGIIVLVIGIAFVAVGIYSVSSFISPLESSLTKFTNATAITLNPHTSHNVTYFVTSAPSVGFFVYNYSSPLSVSLPNNFVKGTSINNKQIYEYNTTSPTTFIISFFNNDSVPVTVYYTFITLHISSFEVIGGALFGLGIFVVIIGIALAIIGVILGRRRRT